MNYNESILCNPLFWSGAKIYKVYIIFASKKTWKLWLQSIHSHCRETPKLVLPSEDYRIHYRIKMTSWLRLTCVQLKCHAISVEIHLFLEDHRVVFKTNIIMKTKEQSKWKWSFNSTSLLLCEYSEYKMLQNRFFYLICPGCTRLYP